MFDWFGRKYGRRCSTGDTTSDMEKIGNDTGKVITFPEPKASPYLVPAPEPEAETYYSIGITSDNRITLKIGYATLNMNKIGVQNLIKQLAVFKSQLHD
jgi:hypothetical protein